MDVHADVIRAGFFGIVRGMFFAIALLVVDGPEYSSTVHAARTDLFPSKPPRFKLVRAAFSHSTTPTHHHHHQQERPEQRIAEPKSHQEQPLQLALPLPQLEVVLDERADLAGAEDGDDEARQEQCALDQLRVHHPQEPQVEDGQGEVHDDGQLHLELVDLEVLQDLPRVMAAEYGASRRMGGGGGGGEGGAQSSPKLYFFFLWVSARTTVKNEQHPRKRGCSLGTNAELQKTCPRAFQTVLKKVRGTSRVGFAHHCTAVLPKYLGYIMTSSASNTATKQQVHADS